MKQTRRIRKGDAVYKAVIYQLEQNRPHTYQGKQWEVYDVHEDGPNHVLLLLKGFNENKQTLH